MSGARVLTAGLALSFVLAGAAFAGPAAGARYALRRDPLIPAGARLAGSLEADASPVVPDRVPPPLPEVFTEGAFPSETSAVLTGFVLANGGGRLTDCEFLYESAHSGKLSVPCEVLTEEITEGGKTWEVEAEARGLEPHTTYEYQLYAENRHGHTYGKQLRFRTLPEAPFVATGAASPIGRTSATLNATVNPYDEKVKECYFEWGTTSSYGNVTPCSSLPPGSAEEPVAVAAAIKGLSEITTYHFRVVAVNPYGTAYGPDETFETLPDAPAVVTGTASAIARTSATLNATVNPDGEEVTECYFEWGTTNGYGNIAACSSPPGSGESPVAVSAPLEGLGEATTYYFRVVATNARGTRSGADGTFATRPYPPAVVTGAASAITRTSATLNATVNPDGEEVTECYFEWGTTSSYGNIAACSSLPGSGESPVAVSAPLEGLSEASTYYFHVVAGNARAASEGSSETFATLPYPPTVVTDPASSITDSSATLNGTVNPNGGTVSSCEIEYGTSPTLASAATVGCGSPGAGRSPVPVSASVTHLADATTYYFRVDAGNAGGTGQGDIETFTTLLSAPTVVTGAASSVTSSSAILNGTVNPNGGTVSSCEIEYGTSPTLAGATTASCGSPGSGDSPVPVSVLAEALTPLTSYYFRVQATNSGGTGEGAINTFTTLPNPPEFGRCVAVPAGQGKYGSLGCTSPGGKADYEWTSGVAATGFTTELASGSITLASAAKTSSITCTGESGGGEYTGVKTVGAVTLAFTGCKRDGEGCASAGAAAGEIVSQALAGELGVDKRGATEGKNEIGLDLHPIAEPGPVMAFTCGASAVTVQGSVIVPVTSNKMSLTQTLKFKAKKGKQEPESFAGEPKDVLEASIDAAPPVQTGLTMELTQTDGEPVEVSSSL